MAQPLVNDQNRSYPSEDLVDLESLQLGEIQTMPDPGADPLGYFRWLGKRIVMIGNHENQRRLSATAAARYLGYTESSFRGRPWRIPYFGAHGTKHPYCDLASLDQSSRGRTSCRVGCYATRATSTRTWLAS